MQLIFFENFSFILESKISKCAFKSNWSKLNVGKPANLWHCFQFWLALQRDLYLTLQIYTVVKVWVNKIWCTLCCIPNCNTGYRSASSSERISIFRFPRDEQLKAKWLKAIPRKNWTLTDLHRVCVKHFNANDFQTTSSDSNNARQSSCKTEAIQACHLKANAISTIFFGLPAYLSSKIKTSLSSSTSSSAHLSNENARIEEGNNSIML